MASTNTVPREQPRRNASSRKATRSAWMGLAWVCLLFLVIAAGVIYERPMTVADAGIHLRLRMAGIDSRYVRVGPYRVHYFVGGKGKPLLLIHGLGGRAEDWTPEMPAYLKQGFRVYAIDLLGCGRTSRPNIAYSMQEQSDMVQGFLNALHVQRTDVAGWSMGGWITLLYALQHPAHVNRVVVMDSAGLIFQAHFGAQVFEPKTPEQLSQLMTLLTPHPDVLPAFVERDVLRRMKQNSPVIHRAVQTMLTGQDLLDGKLQNIHVPVLIVWGAQDELIPPTSGEQMHQAMPQSVLELYQGCGHLAPATCADRVVPHVLDFLRSEPAMAGGTYHY